MLHAIVASSGTSPLWEAGTTGPSRWRCAPHRNHKLGCAVSFMSRSGPILLKSLQRDPPSFGVSGDLLVRIAQVAPLAEAVPPKFYGGTERVVSWLTEELVRQGHDVTLFASGDSETSAKLVACCPEGLRLAGIRDHVASHLAMLYHLRRRADEFDVIHFHIDLLQYPLFEDLNHKCVTTLHGRLDVPDFMPVYRTFTGMPLRSIAVLLTATTSPCLRPEVTG